MGGPSSRHMFHNLTFTKTVDEILAKVGTKIAFLHGKIREREARIVRIREEFNISEADMTKLFAQAAANEGTRNMAMSYNIQNSPVQGQDTPEVRLVPAGVVQNLIVEQNLISSESASIEKLERIKRNLRPVPHFASNGTMYTQTEFMLTEDELDFLGF